MRQQPEKQEQAAIVKLLKLLGASVYIIGTKRRKGDYQGTMQTPGIPDLYVFMPVPNTCEPCFVDVWIEVKAPKGRASEAQQAFQQHCANADVRHLVGGIDVVTEWLRKWGWIK